MNLYSHQQKVQPIFTDRNDNKNKSNTINEIIKRSNPNSDWPQVLIFPEGTTTNGSCLISFKAGIYRYKMYKNDNERSK
jgi:1-acyl-sn-glycerol-3-phosphate acyltransferase